MKEKEIIEYQIKIGLIDIKYFLKIYPFLFSDNENESIKNREKKFTKFRYKNPDFPVRKIGKIVMIDLEDLKKWLKKKKKIETYEDVEVKKMYSIIDDTKGFRELPIDKGTTQIIDNAEESVQTYDVEEEDYG